jgi:hypothetical protein
MRMFNYMSDSHIITGEVVGTRVEGDSHLIDVEFRGTSQRGEVTCPAKATISLPSWETALATFAAPPQEMSRIAAQMLKRHGELRADRTGS